MPVEHSDGEKGHTQSGRLLHTVGGRHGSAELWARGRLIDTFAPDFRSIDFVGEYGGERGIARGFAARPSLRLGIASANAPASFAAAEAAARRTPLSMFEGSNPSQRA